MATRSMMVLRTSALFVMRLRVSLWKWLNPVALDTRSILVVRELRALFISEFWMIRLTERERSTDRRNWFQLEKRIIHHDKI